MSINHIILQNLKKNIKNYYLYVFALIFSVALYFSFVTLQYDPSMTEAKDSVKGAASLKAASVLLIVIVSIFLLYANNIFIKRRSKEIGLFQLIGMTKTKIFRILTAENFLLYFGSLLIGILVGLSFSKLIKMIFFKITMVEITATLHFSTEAFVQTMIVFVIIYCFIMLTNYLFIKKQSILSLFRTLSSTEEKVKKVSIIEMIIGIFGIVLIISGYYISSKLFGGDFTTVNGLFLAMVTVLAFVIFGTYLFFKGSVRFIFYMIRKRKDGYLNIHEVLSLSSIMFRMKSNGLLLTIITTVSALAIGLLSLSYIAYYSAESSAKNSVAADFSILDEADSELFKQALDTNYIGYTERKVEVIQADLNLENIAETRLDAMVADVTTMTTAVVSDEDFPGIDLAEDEVQFNGFSYLLETFISLKSSGEITLNGLKTDIPLQYIGLEKDAVVSNYFTTGGPAAIVDSSVFEQLKKNVNPDLQKKSSIYIGIDIENKEQLEEANTIFEQTNFSSTPLHESLLNVSNSQKQAMGLIMFIVGFLGLTFLVTSGCILYFKQMDESEEEKPNYTILRKLGFTESDLIKGIQAKQLFNFGIPLVLGLFHSYFAVKSGWFFFGSELWTPMIIVMGLYTALYSIFGMLSILYYKKVIKHAL